MYFCTKKTLSLGQIQTWCEELLSQLERCLREFCSSSNAVGVKSLSLCSRSMTSLSLLEVTHTQLRQHLALTYFWEQCILFSSIPLYAVFYLISNSITYPAILTYSHYKKKNNTHSLKAAPQKSSFPTPPHVFYMWQPWQLLPQCLGRKRCHPGVSPCLCKPQGAGMGQLEQICHKIHTSQLTSTLHIGGFFSLSFKSHTRRN